MEDRYEKIIEEHKRVVSETKMPDPFERGNAWRYVEYFFRHLKEKDVFAFVKNENDEFFNLWVDWAYGNDLTEGVAEQLDENEVRRLRDKKTWDGYPVHDSFWGDNSLRIYSGIEVVDAQIKGKKAKAVKIDTLLKDKMITSWKEEGVREENMALAECVVATGFEGHTHNGNALIFLAEEGELESLIVRLFAIEQKYYKKISGYPLFISFIEMIKIYYGYQKKALAGEIEKRVYDMILQERSEEKGWTAEFMERLRAFVDEKNGEIENEDEFLRWFAREREKGFLKKMEGGAE